MRLSEKTIEINLCSQINEVSSEKLFWFGLTQEQESKAGFDVATTIGKRMILIQFKASNKVLKRSGARRFSLEHTQLQKLLNRSSGIKRSIYYAFPMIGNTSELNSVRGDLINNSKLLDISKLPNPYPLPTSNRTPIRVRKSNCHYADVLGNQVTIHSDPLKFNLDNIEQVLRQDEPEEELINVIKQGGFDRFRQISNCFSRNARFGVILK